MRVITVSQLNKYVKSLLEGDPNLAAVYISGEISNFTNHYKSGHLYLSLKDEGALVKAVMFRAYASKLAFTPENGMKVIVKARVSLYDKDGSFQIYIEEMQPDGVGALQVAFEQLKQKLSREGLFDRPGKSPFPGIPPWWGSSPLPPERRCGIFSTSWAAGFPWPAWCSARCWSRGRGRRPSWWTP